MIVKGYVIFERTLLSRKKLHKIAWSCAISNIFYCDVVNVHYACVTFERKIWVSSFYKDQWAKKNIRTILFSQKIRNKCPKVLKSRQK